MRKSSILLKHKSLLFSAKDKYIFKTLRYQLFNSAIHNNVLNPKNYFWKPSDQGLEYLGKVVEQLTNPEFEKKIVSDFIIYVEKMCAEFQRVIDRTEKRILMNLNKAMNNTNKISQI